MEEKKTGSGHVRLILCVCAAVLLAAAVLFWRYGESFLPDRSHPQGNGECYRVYFLRTEGAHEDDGIYAAEELWFENGAPAGEELARQLLDCLLEGPADPLHYSPIPQGTTLTSVKLRNGRAVVDFSAEYDSLQGISLTLADYAVTLTLTQMPEVNSVQIQVRGHELDLRDRQILTPGDGVLVSQSDVVGTVRVMLYLPAGGRLDPEVRTLDLYEGDTQVRAVLRELREESGNLPVQAVWQDEELCYVDLTPLPPAELEEPQIRLLLQGVERSFQSLQSIEQVRFLVNGELADFWGMIPLTEAAEQMLASQAAEAAEEQAAA